jgi:hypothetical protein
MKRAIVCLAVLTLTACATAVAPQAEAIRTTTNPADVAKCAVVGSVEAEPPYMMPGDDLKQMKNAALVLNADTVFVTRRAGKSQGVAYRCATP